MADVNSIHPVLFPDAGDLGKKCRSCNLWKPLSQFPITRPPKRSPRRHSYCGECLRQKGRALHAKLRDDPEYKRKKVVIRRRCHLRKQFDMSLEDYEAMLAGQGGVCAICRQEETWVNSRKGSIGALAVDHDHSTGKVRGLLCNSCNVLIALSGERTEVLRAAIAYLEHHASSKAEKPGAS